MIVRAGAAGGSRLRAAAARAAGPALALALAAFATADAAPRWPVPQDRAGADHLATLPESGERDDRLASWARNASLDDVLWVLRREPAQLGRAESALLAAALKRVPPARAELRRQLEVRALRADPRAARRAGLPPEALELRRCGASAFRVGVLLPDRGDYAGYASEVRAGIDVGLRAGTPPGAPLPESEFHGTGDGDAAIGAAALDSVSRTCDAVIGELLSVPTTALAAAARVYGLPLVSPTATDEGIGGIGPTIFQVGPSSALRARALARAVVRPGLRVGILTSSANGRAPFVDAFAAAAESLGAKLVRRDVYPAGTIDFHLASRSVRTFGAEVLFWDGESREADGLLRQLAADGVSVRLCGGAALAPEQFHTTSRSLLEGVTWVADDWVLAPTDAARLDSLARARGDKPGPLAVRGYLAGRRIADAIAAGARTPGEIAAHLRPAEAGARTAGFLDVAPDGATLPVYTLNRGHAVELGTRAARDQ
ncbi:MAG TPA: ABC transporter substrate-binding protein [Candidatus Acidoferrales bacterium]|nr:ABC transporter substrate-binding protein [Candidatus Acidoferrales bacterium]